MEVRTKNATYEVATGDLLTTITKTGETGPSEPFRMRIGERYTGRLTMSEIGKPLILTRGDMMPFMTSEVLDIA